MEESKDQMEKSIELKLSSILLNVNSITETVKAHPEAFSIQTMQEVLTFLLI